MASSWRRLLCLRSGIWSLLFYCVYSHLKLVLSEEVDTCDNLSLGQYRCNNPKIDDATQEPENCRDTTAWVECLPAPNISCRLSNGTEFRFSGEEVGFNKTIPCRNVSGYSYKVAVALSLFLGWLGADRFYLGYPALGMLSLHRWFLWNRHSDRLHSDRHADRGSSRRIQLHRGLLRRPSDAPVHHQPDLQEATPRPVNAAGHGLHTLHYRSDM
ncbi:TM2 domain-containing protein 1-like isoform X1 [Sander lucioperca]|uniref:TM2 domain-containing protein 1-like isoform X1 n=1 Tax=Sander lucioperca TaxID=283035 RepID=UPI001653CA97|nr:TM2 domain-containing protein 1-like isoform X1 [Sander lucioperca]